MNEFNKCKHIKSLKFTDFIKWHEYRELTCVRLETITLWDWNADNQRITQSARERRKFRVRLGQRNYKNKQNTQISNKWENWEVTCGKRRCRCLRSAVDSHSLNRILWNWSHLIKLVYFVQRLQKKFCSNSSLYLLIKRIVSSSILHIIKLSSVWIKASISLSRNMNIRYFNIWLIIQDYQHKLIVEKIELPGRFCSFKLRLPSRVLL